MKRRFTLLAIATFLSGTLMAQWNGETEVWTKGNGSEENPYQIETEAQLAYLAAQVNSGTKYEDVYFKQMADLDLGGVQDTNGIWSGQQWIPIGNNSKKFYGSYNGNGYVISNMYCDASTTAYIGLFGYVLDGGSLTNITLASGYVYGNGYTAGICGALKNGTISYCTNNATVFSKLERNGGVCGWAENATISDCINYGLISGFNFTGGILGHCNTTDVTIQNCINIGQVFGMRATCGNLVGFSKSATKATLLNCYYDNQMNASVGLTTRSDIIETETDASGVIEGKSTSDMIGNKLRTILGETYWCFEDSLYPRLKVKENGNNEKFNYMNDAMILAATPVLLDGDKSDCVAHNFTVSTKNNVLWESSGVKKTEPSVSINGKVAKIEKSTGVILTAKKSGNDNYSKRVYLRTETNGATPMGTIGEPLPIESEADLIELQKAMKNYGTYKGCANYDGFKGIYFEQKTDITLTSLWAEAIGAHNSFKGNYNGNNNKITNINMTGNTNVGGVFCCASYGKIENLTVYGSVSGVKFVGGISGSSFMEEINNCTSYCDVNIGTNTYAGGIVGVDKGFSSFSNCNNQGIITAKQYCGGILAISNMQTKLTNCINYNTINSGTYSAGICGVSNGKDTILYCENYGTIKATSSNAGGILGADMSPIGDTYISNCINIGDVESSGSGIIGSSSQTNITNCLNVGKTYTGNGIANSIGSDYTIFNCFNAGAANNAIAPSSANIDNCINIGNVTSSANSYYDSQLYPSMTGGTGLKTSEMTGDALKTALGEENWIYNEGMYPMPKGLEKSDYMKLAATALILDAEANDNVNSVTKNFKVGTANHVEWTCSPQGKLSFANGHGYISNPGGEDATVTVQVKLSDIQKTFTLTIKPTSSAVPTMAWNTPEDLNINYGATITEEMLSVTISDPDDALSKGSIEYSIAFGPCTLDASDEEHTITATFVPNENVNDLGAASISKKLKINKATATLEWTPEAYTYTYGASDNKSKIESAVAKVNGIAVDGTFKYNIPALTVGEQVVSITEFISTNYELADTIVLPSTKTINVDPIAASISWATPASISYGTALTSQQLSAFSPIEGTLVYKIGDEVVTAASGKILNGGSHTITATLTPTSPNYAPATASVTLTVDPILPTIVWENPADITFGTLLSDKQLNAKVDGVSGDFTYTPNFGERLKAEKNITLRVDFTPKGSDANNYKATYKEVKINVNKADAIIDWEYPANITYGTLLSEVQLNANVSGVTGEYNYTPALGAKLNAGKHELKVDFTPTGDDINNCNAASKTVILTVDKATPEITWNIAETIIAGTALTEDEHLNATANIGGSFVYKEGENIINADDVLPAGSHKLTAIFTPADTANYKSKSKSVTVSVAAKTELTITWAAPAPIVYGTLIDSTILNAKANIDGTFAYSVKAGDALNAGEHTIVATFTPADNSYSVTTDTVLLQVAKANLIVSVADVTVKQGDALPTFNIAYNGFKLNDNESSLTSQVVATSAASTDKAGTFDIVLSGGQSDNYNFEYQNGKLTITATEDTTAIAETEVTFSVYPNPTEDVFFVETNSNVENIFIYNAQGALVKVEPNTGKTRIDISDVETGTYFVKVGEKTIKLLKF
ncbi:MAG: T9SS type A sorting domain-containing protein [Salinivirgaceae bacterium]|nr:T9SS type A sorting domain-containing protein [Salinivirgaceae bacterium]